MVHGPVGRPLIKSDALNTIVVQAQAHHWPMHGGRCALLCKLSNQMHVIPNATICCRKTIDSSSHGIAPTTLRGPSVDLRVGVDPPTRFPGAPILFYFWRLEIGDWKRTENK